MLLAQLKGKEKYYAIKAMKKDVVIEDDDVDSTLVERRILASGTECQFITALHSTFQTEVGKLINIHTYIIKRNSF